MYPVIVILIFLEKLNKKISNSVIIFLFLINNFLSLHFFISIPGLKQYNQTDFLNFFLFKKILFLFFKRIIIIKTVILLFLDKYLKHDLPERPKP